MARLKPRGRVAHPLRRRFSGAKGGVRETLSPLRGSSLFLEPLPRVRIRESPAEAGAYLALG